MAFLDLIIKGKPVPASRPRVAKFGVFYPKAHMEHATLLKKALQMAPSVLFEGPVAVSFLFVIPAFKTSAHIVPRQDVDNLAKLPLDEITQSEDSHKNKRFWQDDDLVVSLKSYKRFARKGEEPHTRIRIRSVPEDYGTYVDAQFEAA
jgi:Holliday junction resolvase RusA-like endonuclease